MICKSPINTKDTGHILLPCGQCMPCRFNHRRMWTTRISLEAQLWPRNAFLTLTYSDDNFPSDGSVSVTDHQDFMKRLRSRWFRHTGEYIRFFGCGEYGEKTFRPHYHYAVFNFPPCEGSGANYFDGKYHSCHCRVCRFVEHSWQKGATFTGALEYDSAQYVAGYVTKKMTSKDDPRLGGRHPEFMRASRNPGLAANFIPQLVDRWSKTGYEGIPSEWKLNGKFMPLGRFLTDKLKKEFSYEVQDSHNAIFARQMFSLLRYVKDDAAYPTYLNSQTPAVAVSLLTKQPVLKMWQRLQRKGMGHEI